jgi:uncharacterized protein (UPF0262 family)
MEDFEDTLINIELCETSLIHKNETIKQGHRTAIRDLIRENYFHIPTCTKENYQGP